MTAPREVVRKAIREGGPELDLMMMLLESALRTLPGFLGGLRIAMKNSGVEGSPVAPFVEALEAWALESQADAFAESPKPLERWVGAGPGLLEDFPMPRPMPRPRPMPSLGSFQGRGFLRLPSGSFLNLKQVITIMEGLGGGSLSVMVLGGTLITLKPEDAKPLRRLLEDAAFHLQPAESALDLGGGR